MHVTLVSFAKYRSWINSPSRHQHWLWYRGTPDRKGWSDPQAFHLSHRQSPTHNDSQRLGVGRATTTSRATSAYPFSSRPTGMNKRSIIFLIIDKPLKMIFRFCYRWRYTEQWLWPEHRVKIPLKIISRRYSSSLVHHILWNVQIMTYYVFQACFVYVFYYEFALI